MRILIADNNIDLDFWGAKEFRNHTAHLSGATVMTRRGPQDDLPKTHTCFDRLIITGSKTSALEQSSWISHLDELIRQTVDAGKPILGVCYGHQAIARALGGVQAVRKSDTPEFGWCKIEVLENSKLFQELPTSFYSFGAHFEEVSEFPKHAKLLASSEHCAVQAFELLNRPVFGIQFHPEKDIDDAKRTFAERKKQGHPKFLLNSDKSETLYNPEIGKTLFRNFFEI